MKSWQISALIITALLPFPLVPIWGFLLMRCTTDGRLAVWLIVASQKMTDQQLAKAIGQDPWAVLRRASLMASALDPLVAILVGVLVALIVKQNAAKITAFALAPFFLWDFSMTAFSTPRLPTHAALYAARVLGTNGAYVAIAAIISAVTGMLLTRVRVRPVQPVQV